MGVKSFFKRNRKEETQKGSLKQREATLEKQKVGQVLGKKRTLIVLHKEKEASLPAISVVPSGCKNYLGYLYNRTEKSSGIPEECIECPEILNCVHAQVKIIARKSLD